MERPPHLGHFRGEVSVEEGCEMERLLLRPERRGWYL